MPKHHYLPATYIASFSNSQIIPRRDRELFVGNVQSKYCFSSSASNVGCEKNLYSMIWETRSETFDPDYIEGLWSKYETGLADAIDDLITMRLDANTWARVLIPFVACMLVRGNDFPKRFHNRPFIRELSIENDKSNINRTRLFELQRLLAPITAAKWIVLSRIGGDPLIINDIGYAPFTNQATGDTGIAIPLNQHQVLVVVPQMGRVVLTAEGNVWRPSIEYAVLSPSNHESLNQVLASYAQRFIFGSSESIVKKYLPFVPATQTPLPPEPGEIGFITRRMALAHEFTWYRLVSFLEKFRPNDAIFDFSLDWEAIASDWAPMVHFPTNLIEFPPALFKLGKAIAIRFYDPEVYFSMSNAVMLVQMEEYQGAVNECTKAMALAKSNAQKAGLLEIRARAYYLLGQQQNADQDIKNIGLLQSLRQNRQT